MRVWRAQYLQVKKTHIRIVIGSITSGDKYENIDIRIAVYAWLNEGGT